MKRRNVMISATAAFALLICAAQASADDDDNDHELAKRALEQGKILPLKDILAALEATVPGEVIDVDLDHETGTFTYEIKVLTTEGRVMEAELDARTARIIGVEPDDD